MATISPRDDDKGFAKFLQQIQAINVNLKESINKDESKLDQLNNIKKSATGISKDTDFKPVVKSLDKLDSVLEKSLKEQVSLRKIILKNSTIGFAAQEAIVPAAIKERKVSPAPTIQQSKKTVEKVVPKRLGQDYLKTGKEDKEEKEPLRFGRPSDFLEGAKERIGSIKSFFSGPVAKVDKKEEDRKENKNTFAEAYASSAKGTQVQKGNQRPSKESSVKAGENLFEKIVKKEDEIKTLEEKIAKQTTAGFQPLKKDLKDIEKLQKDLTGIHTEAGMIPEESKTDTKPKVETRKKVVKEAAITGIEPSKDKIKTETEGIAKESKTDVELSKQQLQITKDSLTQLKAIRVALSPKKEKKDKVSPGSKEASIGKATSKGSITTTAASPAAEGASVTPAAAKSALSTNPLAAADPAVAAAEAPEAGKGILDVASQALDLIPEGGKNPPGKPAGKAAKGIGGRILGGLGKAARFLGPVGAIAGAAYSGFEGYKNTGENFDLKEGQEATAGQKASSTLGGIASGATFGLLDEKTASQGIHKAGTAIGNFFGMGDKSAAVTPAGAAPSTGQAMAKASTENADMTRDVTNQTPSSTSVVSTNVSNNNTTSYVPMKSVPRGEQGSNLDRYLSRTAVY